MASSRIRPRRLLWLLAGAAGLGAAGFWWRPWSSEPAAPRGLPPGPNGPRRRTLCGSTPAGGANPRIPFAVGERSGRRRRSLHARGKVCQRHSLFSKRAPRWLLHRDRSGPRFGRNLPFHRPAVAVRSGVSIHHQASARARGGPRTVGLSLGHDGPALGIPPAFFLPGQKRAELPRVARDLWRLGTPDGAARISVPVCRAAPGGFERASGIGRLCVLRRWRRGDRPAAARENRRAGSAFSGGPGDARGIACRRRGVAV